MTTATQTRTTFDTCTPGSRITGLVYLQGARGVVLVNKLPNPTSQYPDDRRGYVTIYLFDRSGLPRISEMHSHGYAADGSWDAYLRGVVLA